MSHDHGTPPSDWPGLEMAGITNPPVEVLRLARLRPRRGVDPRMTHHDRRTPMANAPVEAKVKAATSATFVVSLVIAVLNAVVADDSLLQPLPSWLQQVIIAVVPAAVTFLSGWQARHTPRSLPRP